MPEESKTQYEQDLTSLVTAFKQNDAEQALNLIKKIPAEHLFHPDTKGRTFLHYAINLGMNDIASAIIRKEDVRAAQLLSRDKNGNTALDDAIRLGQSDRIIEIITNKSIGGSIIFKTFKITGDENLTKIIPPKTIAAAESTLLSEMAKFKKIDSKIIEEKGFRVILGIKPQQEQEIDSLERLYQNSDKLWAERTEEHIKRLQKLQPTLLLEDHSRQR